MCLGQTGEHLPLDVVRVEQQHGVSHRRRHLQRRSAAGEVAEHHHWRGNHERGQRRPDRGDHRSHHERRDLIAHGPRQGGGAGGQRGAAGQLGLDRRQCRRPLRRLDEPCRRIEALRRRGFAVGVWRGNQVDVLDHPGEPRRRLPAVVAGDETGRRARVLPHRIHLEQQVRPRHLAIEVLAKRGRARVQVRRHPLALRAADLSEPLVLQRREQQDQPEQGSGDGEHRHAKIPSHSISSGILARRFAAKDPSAEGFTCLTNS